MSRGRSSKAERVPTPPPRPAPGPGVRLPDLGAVVTPSSTEQGGKRGSIWGGPGLRGVGGYLCPFSRWRTEAWASSGWSTLVSQRH